MTLIELENGFKIRFDPNEIRINIDGEMIDIGARRKEEKESFNPDDYEIPPPGYRYSRPIPKIKKLNNKNISQQVDINSPSFDILKHAHNTGLISDEEYENIIIKRGLRGGSD